MKLILIIWTCVLFGYLLGFFHAALCKIAKKGEK